MLNLLDLSDISYFKSDDAKSTYICVNGNCALLKNL